MISPRSIRQPRTANRRDDRPAIVPALALCTLLAAGTMAPAAAGTNQWTGAGPYGGLVTVLVRDPKTPANLYAAGISGIYKSGDGGANWALASNGIVDPSVDAIAIDPATPTTLYAGSLYGGTLVKSTDGAKSWTPLASGPTLAVAIAIDPKTTSTLYVAQSRNGLSRSSDGGNSWTRLNSANFPNAFATFKALAIDPVTTTTIYAGEQGGGVFKSTDGGATWNAANNGFTGPVIQVLALAVDPGSPATLYAAANTSGGSGLFKSSDGGASWSNVLADKNGVIGVQSVAVDPGNSANVYIGTFSAGMERSTNGGTSFGKIATGLPNVGVNAIAINAQNAADVLIGTVNGAFATANSGGAWAASSNGLALTSVTAVAVDPSTPTTAYAATKYSGLFKSTNAGGSWTAIDNGIGATGNLACQAPIFSSLAIDPNTPATLYAASACTLSNAVYKSTDGGAHWTSSAAGLPAYVGIAAVALDPLATSTVLAASAGNGLYRSADGGTTWAAVDSLAGIQVTGLSFTVTPAAPASSGSRADTAGPLTAPNSSAPSATSGGTSTAAASTSGSGVMVSSDGGKTWTLVPVDSATVRYCNDVYEAVLFYSAGQTSNGVLRNAILACLSLDPNDYLGYTIKLRPGSSSSSFQTSCALSGSSAPVVDQIIPLAYPDGAAAKAVACAPISAATADPLDANGFYAGAACGVLHGTNLGQQLVTMNAGLPTNLQINSIAISPDGSTLYAGAQSGGVYTFSTTGSATPAVNLDQRGLSGAWYNPATSGQGLVMELMQDQLGAGKGNLFAGWYTYDIAPAGGEEKQRWYAVQGEADSDAATASLGIYTGFGGNFNAPPKISAGKVGQATISFSDCGSGQLGYHFDDGRSGSIPLTRLGANVSCTPAGDTGAAGLNLLSGTWYDPATSGQGIVFDLVPSQNLLFAGWYTYAANGSALAGTASQRWYTLQATLPASLKAGQSFAAQIYTGTGGVFDNPTKITGGQVGSATLSFADCGHAMLSYTFATGGNSGLGGSVNLVRLSTAPAACGL